MSKNSRLLATRDTFGLLFLVSNKIETIADRHLSRYKITTKQFFLSLVLIQNRDKILTLTEVANLLGSSRQNTKQLALKLEKIGFCKIRQDTNDKRSLNLEATEKNIQFWKSIDKENEIFLKKIFENLNDKQITSFRSSLLSIHDHLKGEF